jgi:hypothetical protein
MLRLGRSWRRIGALLALVVVGLLTKRTLLPYVALFAGAGLVWLIGAIWRKGWGARGVALAVVLIAGAGLGGWSVRQLNQQAAWGWYLWGGHQQVVRVAAADGPALMIPAGQIAAYQVPAAAGERAKQSLLHFGARISSSDGGRGRLVVLNDQKRHEIRFIADKRADSVDTSATIYPETRGVVLAIQADKGTLQIDQIWATSGTTPIIFPDALAIPGIRAGSPLLTVVQYLRLPELLWTLAIGPHVGALPAGWWALFFASFWGHFGWLSVPFVLDSAWAWALGLFCVLGLLGLPRALMQADRITRLQLLSFVGLALVAVILPLLNALAMPASLSIQQGRYLFPILVPFALLVARGQSALLPARAQKFWLAVWLIFLAIVALGALVRVYGYYHTIG